MFPRVETGKDRKYRSHSCIYFLWMPSLIRPRMERNVEMNVHLDTQSGSLIP